MKSKQFYENLELLAKEKNVEVEQLFPIIEQGLINAYKRMYNGASQARVIFNPVSQTIRLMQVREIVEEIDPERPIEEQITLKDAYLLKKSARLGKTIETEVNPKDFGRLAASSAKGVLKQGLNNVDKIQMVEFFRSMIGEMVSGIVTSVSDRFISLKVSDFPDVILPVQECAKTDSFEIGDRIKVFVKSAEFNNNKIEIRLSRNNADVVKRLFENNTPELADGTVDIVSIAREAGVKTKICVTSHDPLVNPVLTLIGRNKDRITEVTRQLGGNEKVELFEHSTNKIILIANSLLPATVRDVKMSEDNKSAVVIVDDEKLSLAIGKQGMNVRLAVHCTGINMDIKTLSQAQEEGLDITYNVDIERSSI